MFLHLVNGESGSESRQEPRLNNSSLTEDPQAELGYSVEHPIFPQPEWRGSDERTGVVPFRRGVDLGTVMKLPEVSSSRWQTDQGKDTLNNNLDFSQWTNEDRTEQKPTVANMRPRQSEPPLRTSYPKWEAVQDAPHFKERNHDRLHEGNRISRTAQPSPPNFIENTAKLDDVAAKVRGIRPVPRTPAVDRAVENSPKPDLHMKDVIEKVKEGRYAADASAKRRNDPRRHRRKDFDERQLATHDEESENPTSFISEGVVRPGAVRISGFSSFADESVSSAWTESVSIAEANDESTHGAVVAHPVEVTEDFEDGLRRQIQHSVQAAFGKKVETELLSQARSRQQVISVAGDKKDETKEDSPTICGIPRFMALIMICSLMVVVVVVGAVVGVVLSKNSSPSHVHPPQSTNISTMEPYNVSVVKKALGPILSTEAMAEPESPQSRAYEWIMDPNNSIDELNMNDENVIVERFVMATFYYVLAGDTWKEKVDFLSTKSICFWKRGSLGLGIECKGGKSVTDITMVSNGLVGQIPTELALLTKLKVLILDDNDIAGSLPIEWTSLSDTLKELSLEKNSLVGFIPTEFARLTALEEFRLDHNGLVGTIPTQLALLTKLNDLRIADNKLNGTIPTEFGELSSALALIHLSENNLSGTLPSELGQLWRLTTFWVSTNNLRGTIPMEYARLARLRSFIFQNNSLTGDVSVMFCTNRTEPIDQLWADCVEEVSTLGNPRVTCPCCTKCFCSAELPCV